ncbi:MAG: DUF2600 family protein [Solirubrobacteraceae bacterium]
MDPSLATAKAQAGRAGCFVRAAVHYWLAIAPCVTEEFRSWKERAAKIPDPVLRRHALETHREKRESLDGVTTFATFAPRQQRLKVARATIAYQLAFDYIDTITEQPVSDPIANGRQLNSALVSAVQFGVPHCDYYSEHTQQEDGGYLVDLLESFRRSARTLPSYQAIVEPASRVCQQIVSYQSLNHGDVNGSFGPFREWARAEENPASGLWWWETAAAGGSPLPLYALLAAAGSPGVSEDHISALHDAYVPWVASLSTLLDSLLDHEQDLTEGRHSLVAYYRSPEETAERLQLIAAEALRRTQALADGAHHSMILAAMAGFFYSVNESTSPMVRRTTRLVLEAMGDLAKPMHFALGAHRKLRSLTGPRRGFSLDPCYLRNLSFL